MKKQIVFIIGAAIIGFFLVFAACSDEIPEDEVKLGTFYLGETLNLSGQVYTKNRDSSYAGYIGARIAVSDGGESSGEIINGKLNFTTEAPDLLLLKPVGEAFLEWDPQYNNFRYSDPEVLSCMLNLEINAPPYTRLARELEKTTSYEWVEYIYVDRDITITADGKTYTVTGDDFVYTTSNLSLDLLAGWNAVYYKDVKKLGTYTAAANRILGNPPHLYLTLLRSID